MITPRLSVPVQAARFALLMGSVIAAGAADGGTVAHWRFTSIRDSEASLTLGATDTPGGFFDGLVDNVRISDLPLDGADLLEPQPPIVDYTALWEFEDDPGFLADSAGRHPLAQAQGTVTQVVPSPHEGSAASFDGASYLSAADAPDWTDQTFTVELYFNSADAASGTSQVLVCHFKSGAFAERSWLVGLNSGRVRFIQGVNGGAGSATRDAFALESGKDYYLAAIIDAAVANTVTLVLKNLSDDTDPESVIFGTAGPILAQDVPLTIGSTSTPSSPFAGKIDSVKISPDALDPQDLPFPPAPQVINAKADGYKGIWFTLGQFSTFGDKYSGGLGTYTAKHVPLAVYAPAVDKTFFVYGGTRAADDDHLLIMASEFDHATNSVPKPTIVMDRSVAVGTKVNDPHDNPAIVLDADGYLWIFASGRAGSRQDFTFRSTGPYSADAFVQVGPPGGEIFAYPQIWHLPGQGFIHLLTIYDPGRELYFRTSADGLAWSPLQQLGDMEGHYQVSWRRGNKVGTMFNRHPGRNVDKRTDLFYVQTTDFGQIWTTVDGTALPLPLADRDSPSRVFDGVASEKLVYLNDLNFDAAGNPILFFTTASNAGGNAHQPGPFAEPRRWVISHWDGSQWNTHELPPSATATSTVTHNYDTGSLYVDGNEWTIIGPSGADPDLEAANPNRFWGQGGEIEVWKSTDQGATWNKDRQLTRDSVRNHGYVRRAFSAHERFHGFWTDGNPETFTESHLYFCNQDGTRYWELPYDMTADTAQPVEVDPPFGRWLERYFTPAEIADPDVTGSDADPDGDGRTNLEEYGQGTDPSVADTAAPDEVSFMESGGEVYPLVSVELASGTFDLGHEVQVSTDLREWLDAGSSLDELSVTDNGASTSFQYLDSAAPLSGAGSPSRYYRRSFRFAP
ncbi:hypothetical protein BH23VER1_BH23VER1_11510 [soil metagenome]